MKQILARLAVVSALAVSNSHAAEKALYENDLSKAQLNQLPDEFLVLDGGFEVKEENGNKFIELPGAPLETFGFMFGPSEKENVAVSARVHAEGKGRRFSTFTVACNGIGGFKLTVAPAKKAVELYKGDTLLESKPFDWKSGKWTNLRIQLKKKSESEWEVAGFVSQEGQPEAKEPAITHTLKEAPSAGRAAVFGLPYAGTPIRFDDLKVTKLE